MTFGQAPNLSFVLFPFAPVLSVFGLGRIFLLVLVSACCFLFTPSISLAAVTFLPPVCFTCPILFVLPVNPLILG